jgi:hypothetical protein
MPSNLVVDDDAWSRAGDELRRRDPARYLAILQIVQDINAIHRDPLGAARTSGHFVLGRPRNDGPLD